RWGSLGCTKGLKTVRLAAASSISASRCCQTSLCTSCRSLWTATADGRVVLSEGPTIAGSPHRELSHERVETSAPVDNTGFVLAGRQAPGWGHDRRRSL